MKHIKIRNWKDLHPAPRHEVPDKNCCDCIFFLSASTNPESTIGGLCNLHNRTTSYYDECSAFTLKLQPAEKGKTE